MPRTDPADPVRFIKLPPPLYDGDFYTLINEFEGAEEIGRRLLAWMVDAPLGETIELSVVEMTMTEYNALPDGG